MKWYKMEKDSWRDYAIINRKTGEKEAIIAKHHGKREWIRFVKNSSGKWDVALYYFSFPNLAAVKEYYDSISA